MLSEEEKKKREKEFDDYFSNSSSIVSDDIQKRADYFDSYFGNGNTNNFINKYNLETDQTTIKNELNDIFKQKPINLHTNNTSDISNEDNSYNYKNEQNSNLETDNKEAGLGEKAWWVARKTGAGVVGGTAGLGQAVLTDTANSLQKGNEKGLEGINEDLKNTNKIQKEHNQLINKAVNSQIKVKEIMNDEKSSTVDKVFNLFMYGIGQIMDTIGSARENTAAGKLIDTPVQVAGALLPEHSSQDVMNLNNSISKPIEEMNTRLAEEGQNYDTATQFFGNAMQAVGNMAPSIAATAITKNPNIGLGVMGLSAKGQSTQEALSKGVELNKAVQIGDEKAMVEIGTEMLTGGINIFGKGALDDILEKGIVDRVKNKVGKFLVKQGVNAAGETLEETISDIIDTAIDKDTVDPNAKYTLSDWSETAIETTLTTFVLNLLTGGVVNDIQTIKNEPTEFKTIVNQDDIKPLYVTNKTPDGDISFIQNTTGIEIENSNKNLNINPAIFYNNKTETYNVLDKNTGLLLDSSPYQSIIEAKTIFNHRILNLSNSQVKNINNNITKTELALMKKAQEFIDEINQNTNYYQNKNEIVKSNQENYNINNASSTENKKSDNLNNNITNDDYGNVSNLKNENSNSNNIQNYNINTNNLTENKKLDTFDKNKINNVYENTNISKNVSTVQNNTSNSNHDKKSSTFYSDETNYAINDIKKVTEPFRENRTYTKNELADIWNNNISDNEYDVVYDKNGNIQSYIAIEEEGNNLVVNQYDNQDNIVKSEIIPENNGKYTAEAVRNTIEKVSSIYDENKPIKGQVDIEGNEVKENENNNKINNNISPEELSSSIERFKNAKGNIDRQDVLNIANSLNIKLKSGAKIVNNTEMSKKAGNNIKPNIVNITDIFKNINDKNAKDFRNEAENMALELFRDKEVTIIDTNSITEINKSGIDKTFSGSVTENKIQTADNIKEIIEQGIYDFTSYNPNDKNNILYHHFFTPVNYKRQNGLVRVVIKEFTKDSTVKDKFYYHQLEYIDNNKIKDISSALPQSNGNKDFELISSINNSISQKKESVKNDKNTVINKDMQKEKNNTNIQDFGEKIGGARKDLSGQRDITKTNNKEVIHNYTVQNTENGYSVNFKNKTLKDGFKSQKEAEQYILDFKENIKNNMAFVEEGTNGDETRYAIKLRNPRTLKTEYTGKVFTNKLDAESYAIALSIYLKEHGKNLFRPEIQKVERVNPNNKNATKTTGNDILNYFGFKGGEFGNWVNQTERQEFLNYAQNAFTDLAIALDIDESSLGQNNEMNIAFGARGKGLTGAVAHFEPDKHVINMTRLKGAGSLAHEYGHSIDNYLSRIGGYNDSGMVTTNSRNPKLSDNMNKAVNEVINAMNYNVSTDETEIANKNSIYEKNRKDSLQSHMGYLDRIFNGEATTYKYNRKTKQREQVPITVTEKQKQEYQRIKNTLLEGKLEGEVERKLNSSTLKVETIYPEEISTLEKMYKEVIGRKIDEDTLYWIYRYGKPAKQITSVKSESAFSKSAVELDRATGRKSRYFSKTEEMWARAFEAYVSDKLKEKGITNTYLVHSVNNNEYALFNPFPAGEERKNINKAFDNLIQTMKEEGFFKGKAETLISSKNNDDIRYMKKSNTTSSNTQKDNTLIAQHNTTEKQIQKELHNRIQNAIISKNSRGRTYLGDVSTKIANTVKKLFGFEVSDRRHVLADNDIRHMIKEHGNPEIEKTKGQIAITTKDIEKIPDIINNYDRIMQGNDNREGKTIRYIKNYSDNVNYVVEVIPEKGSALKIKTMWKKPVRVTNSQQTPSSTSKTKSGLSSSTSNTSITQNAEIVKNEDIRFAKRSAKENNIRKQQTQRNAERSESYIEQEIKKIEKTGNWDYSIPATKLTDIRRTLENYLGLGVQKGHFGQQAYGIYKTNRDVLRTKELKDMDTILHETGHALDLGNRIKIDKESISDELLTAISKTGEYENETRQIQLDEGFAEIIREYSIVPDRAKTEYPQTVAVLEGIRQNDKSFDNFINKVQQQTYNYIHQNPQYRLHSNESIGEQTDKPQLSKEYIKQEVMRNIYDKDYALKVAVNELNKGKNLTASDNAYYLTRLASGIGDKVISMLSNGYIDENGNKLMPGLNKIGEILGNDPERFNDLRDYLVARRDTDYKSKTLKTGIRSMDSQYVIEKFKNDAQIQEAAKLVYDTLDGVLQYVVNNHLIDQESANKIKESNAFYVPMQRVLGNNGNNVGRKGAVADVIKKRTGSELDVKDVLENIIANSSNMIQQVENNNILRALYKEGESSGLTGAVYDVIDTPMIKVGTATLQTWENELKNQGINTTKLDLNKTIDLFAPNNKVDSQNLITSFIDTNGKRVYLQFQDELLFNSIMNMDKEFMSKVLKISRTLNMPLRYGATMANLGFAIPNMISDTAQASIYSTAGFIPVVDNAIGVIDVLAATNKTAMSFLNKVAPQYAKKVNSMYNLYKQSGATSATRMSQYRESTQNLMKDVYGTKNSQTLGIQEKYKPLKRLLDILTYIPELSEKSTRFRVFERNYDYYKNKGNSEMDTRIMAALESRDATQDFGRTGNLTREINQLIPFSAARVGSAYTFAEKVKANPKKVGMRIAILTTLAMVINAMGYDDDEIEELNQRKKDDNFVLKIGDNIVTIKKPQGILRSMINLAEYIQDLFTGHIEEGKEGERLGEWIKNALKDNLPADSIPAAFASIPGGFLVENAINKDFYYNTDIVKSYDLDLPDEQQYYDYNSQLAILLGKAFNYSPAKIDNAINGMFGGLGTTFTNIIDNISGTIGLSPKKPDMGAEENTIGKRFVVNVNSNSASIDEMYNRKTELTKKSNSEEGLTTDEKEQLEKLTNATSNISKINKQIKEIKKDLTMSGKEKAEQIKLLQQQKTDMARESLGKEVLYEENKEKNASIQFYTTSSTLQKSGYTLDMTSEMKKEYEKVASDYYSKYKNQGLYNEEKLEQIKSKAKDYAKNYMFSKYKSNITKTNK